MAGQLRLLMEFLMDIGDKGALLTSRLSIRELKNEDGPLIVRWRNQTYIRNVSRNDKTLTIEEHKRWFDGSRERRLDFIFADRESNEAIGLVSFERSEIGGTLDQYYELSKYIGNEAYMGRGLAYEACEKLLIALEDEEGIPGIFAVTRKDNETNIRVNAKLGFRIADSLLNPNMDPTVFFLMVKTFSKSTK